MTILLISHTDSRGGWFPRRGANDAGRVVEPSEWTGALVSRDRGGASAASSPAGNAASRARMYDPLT